MQITPPTITATGCTIFHTIRVQVGVFNFFVEKEDRKVSAKSLLGVLSLGVAKGMTITLIADGQDENAAVAGLVELIENGFAEY